MEENNLVKQVNYPFAFCPSDFVDIKQQHQKYVGRNFEWNNLVTSLIALKGKGPMNHIT